MAKPIAEGLDAASAGTAWYQEVSRQGWRALGVAGLGWTLEIYDIFVLSLTIPAFTVAFHLTNAGAGLIASWTALGLIVGGVLSGFLADRIGRARTLAVSIVVYSVFSGLIALAVSPTQVAALRFVAGLGMGAEWTAGAALVAETWPARHRGKGGALMQAGLPMGSLLAVGVTALVSALTVDHTLNHGAWRILYALGALPLLFAVYVWFAAPESPLWRPGGDRSGRDQVGSVAAAVRGLLLDGNLRPLLAGLAFIFCIQYVYWAVFTFAPTFLITVRHLVFIKSLPFVLAQQVGSLIGFLVFGALTDRWGRRPVFVAYLVLGGLDMVLFVLTDNLGLLLLSIALTGFSIAGIFAGAGPWAAELMHRSRARGAGMGIIYNGGRIGGFVAPSVVGLLAVTASGFQVGLLTTLVAFVLAIAVVTAAGETRGAELQ